MVEFKVLALSCRYLLRISNEHNLSSIVERLNGVIINLDDDEILDEVIKVVCMPEAQVGRVCKLDNVKKEVSNECETHSQEMRNCQNTSKKSFYSAFKDRQLQYQKRSIE